MPEIDRLVEIKTSASGKVIEEGSGYLIAPNLVLTAAHVVAGGNGFGLRILGEYRRKVGEARLETRAGRPVWPDSKTLAELGSAKVIDPDNDFALLTFDGPTLVPADPVIWHGIPVGLLDVEGLGFPSSAIFKNKWLARLMGKPPFRERDTQLVAGKVRGGDAWKQRAYGAGEFAIEMPPERLPEGAKEGWKGVSGAALFMKLDRNGGREALVGIVRSVSAFRELHQLMGLPVARIFERQDVIDAIRQNGLSEPPRLGHGLPIRLDLAPYLYMLDRTDLFENLTTALAGWKATNEPTLFLAFRGRQEDSLVLLFERSRSELAKDGFLIKQIPWPEVVVGTISEDRLTLWFKREISPPADAVQPSPDAAPRPPGPQGDSLIFIVSRIPTKALREDAAQGELIRWWRRHLGEAAVGGRRIVMLFLLEDESAPAACYDDPEQPCPHRDGERPNALPPGLEAADWRIVPRIRLVEVDDISDWVDYVFRTRPEWQAVAVPSDVKRRFERNNVLPRGVRCINTVLPKLLEGIRRD